MKSSGLLLLAAALTFGGLAAAGQTTSWTTGTYVYDGSGNIKNIGTQVYQYDALGRLVSGTVAPSQTQSVTYDAFGNIRTMTTAGIPITFGVNPATNRMDRTSDPGVTYSAYAGYDTAGRMTSTLGGLDTFDYDAVDMVTRSRVENITRVYLYTEGDERLASIPVSSGVESCLLINGQQICPEWTLRDASARVPRRLEKNGDAWSWKEDYIYAGGTLVAAEVDGPEKTRHFFADHLGTPRLITGSGGTQIAQHTYYPFGGEASSSTQDAEKLKFTGHERDAGSLDYMHARYYAPKWGRFLSVDPVLGDPHQPQSWNRYTYVLNNPLRYTDPDGRCTVDGEKHGVLWCFAHTLGLVYTQRERASALRDYFAGNNIVVFQNGNPVDPSKLSDKQVFEAWQGYTVQHRNNTVSTHQVNGAASPFMTQWGWNNTTSYRTARADLDQPGPHLTANGKIPTKAEAIQMIEENGGKIIRIEKAHGVGGVSTHTYPHINYETSAGVRAAVRTLD